MRPVAHTTELWRSAECSLTAELSRRSREDSQCREACNALKARLGKAKQARQGKSVQKCRVYYEGPAGLYIHGACPTWRDTCRVHMRACVAGEWGTAHSTGHDLSLDLCADHILWHHIVCPMDGDRPPAGRQSADSWQGNVDGLTADGLTGCMPLCNAPAVNNPTQGSDLWRGTLSLCHSLFMQDTTCYKEAIEEPIGEPIEGPFEGPEEEPVDLDLAVEPWRTPGEPVSDVWED